ncbi:hypothetical protein EP232_00520 [bacterium]|nr:MAG: hypothetical protein EP232_00520 [bacterium]
MNKISAQLSVYPLRQTELTPGISKALDAIGDCRVEKQIGVMSTMLWGEDEEVFRALLSAFRQAASVGKTTMVITVSNASPWPGKDD